MIRFASLYYVHTFLEQTRNDREQCMTIRSVGFCEQMRRHRVKNACFRREHHAGRSSISIDIIFSDQFSTHSHIVFFVKLEHTELLSLSLSISFSRICNISYIPITNLLQTTLSYTFSWLFWVFSFRLMM